MHLATRAIVLLALVACTTPAPGGVAPPPVVAPIAAEPAMLGSLYARPPHQGSGDPLVEWSLPPSVVSAADKLFEIGLPDPRGCSYRAVSFVIADVEDLHRTTKVATHAFVLPGDAFAIGWNGLVYPIDAPGDAVDLATDGKAMVEAARAENLHPLYEDVGLAEPLAISATAPSALRVVLLLRLGEADQAFRLWDAWSRALFAKSTVRSPFSRLSFERINAAFDRGIAAHLRGDDRQAWESLLPIATAASAIEEECARVGKETPSPCVPFLGPLNALQADTQRRLLSPAPPLDLTTLVPLPAQERVARLVRALDQVDVDDTRILGDVPLSSHPLVQALVREGENAVSPLIDVAESDTRLTRSLAYRQESTDARAFLPVGIVAVLVAEEILDTRFFPRMRPVADRTRRREALLATWTDDERRDVVLQLRAYWATRAGLSRPERWRAELADDDAGLARSMLAAEHITGSRVATTVGPPGTGTPPPGEPLRKETAPTLSQLFASRVEATLVDLPSACAFAHAFASWDRPASVPALARVSAVVLALAPPRSQAWWAPAACASELTEDRMDLDPTALVAYSAWVLATDDEQLEGLVRSDVLGPLLKAPKSPALAPLARALFGEGGRLMPLYRPHAALGTRDHTGLLGTSLVRVPLLKEHILHELANPAHAGTLTVHPTDPNAFVILWDSGEGSSGVAPLGTRVAPPKTKMDVRVADLFAMELAAQSGAPPFEEFWPKAKRDASIAAMMRFVRGL